MKKITIIYLALMLALPVLLHAQYMGGDGRGDIKVSLTNITIPVQEISVILPTKYDLAQNYPNPFNLSTVIRFQLSVAGNALLKVYDVLGKEVATLVNETLKPGTYEATFDGSQLPSGIYFAKLEAGSYKHIIKMLMVK